MRPRIGITCDYETFTDRRGVPGARFELGEPYVRAVLDAGGLPIMLAHSDQLTREYLDLLDGLVLSGGDFDIPPSYYGQTPRPRLGSLDERRSAAERALLEGALERRLPVLGVCGGMQLINVVFGGTLFQDVSERPQTAVHEQPNDKRQPSHGLRITPGSLLARLVGSTETAVNSTHHQLVDKVAPTLVASGVAPDGVVEAIEASGDGFILGVQWHPEVMDAPGQQAIYDGFVRAARAR